MRLETKGLTAGSLFKFCFIGLFFSMLILSILSTLGGYLVPEDWSGPKGEITKTTKVLGQETVEESIDTSKGLADLVGYLFALPFITAILTAMIWFFLLIGQFIYSMFKPIHLTNSAKGLDLGSSFKLCIIGWTFSWTPFALLSSIIGVFESSNFESIKVNDEPITPILAITLSLVLIPLGGVMCGAIIGIFTFIGQQIYGAFRPMNLELIPFNTIQNISEP